MLDDKDVFECACGFRGTTTTAQMVLMNFAHKAEFYAQIRNFSKIRLILKTNCALLDSSLHQIMKHQNA